VILRRILLGSVLLGLVSLAGDLKALRQGLEVPPADSRPMMRWWWFGPSATPAELERELKAMKAGGLGGVEIQPVYPLALDGTLEGVRNYSYLSPEYLSNLQFAAKKAKELGLRVDLTLGSGWPYGGPHISRDLAAAKLRVEKLSAPGKLAEGETVLAEFPNQDLRFVKTVTRQMVKRAAVGAEGPVLNHYKKSALDRHLEVVAEPQMKALAGLTPYAVFNDSLEVYGGDWTDELLAEFQKRRGYDLKPLLPALTGAYDAEKGSIRNDWALTLTELVEENFLQPMQKWAAAHGTKFRSQTYGIPPVTISSQRYVDLADGEKPHWKQLTPTRWASSGNHLLGRTITATETWTWLHSPSFAATPLDVKAEADRHYLQGVNELIGHGWPYSPASAPKPGWAFYAAANFNDNNPWYPVMGDLTAYLARMNWLMRQGKPVTDVALYLPVGDIRARFTVGSGRVSIDQGAEEGLSRVIPAILEAGYTFDVVDDGLLDAALGGGYKALVLPNVERIPASSYSKIEQFALRGGLVIAIGHKPFLAPGKAAAGTTPQVAATTARLFGGAGAKGTTLTEAEGLGVALAKRVAPDVVCVPANAEIGFFHRKDGETEIYFVANTGNRPWRGVVKFRDVKGPVEWWDGRAGKARAVGAELELAPYESVVALAGPGARPAVVKASGKALEKDLSQDWRVTFAGRAPVAMGQLKSWTEEEATRFYSGVATYEKSFRLEAGWPAEGVWLEFGEAKAVDEPRRPNGMRAAIEAPVRDAAIVFVNGRRAGSMWSAPYRLDLSGLMKEGENTLRIEVANTALNELAKTGEPDYKALSARYGERFQMQDMRNMRPEQSGLLGPIRLVTR